MIPSLTPMVEPSAKARLYARAGKPMLSTISSRSFSGMISRILSSTAWKIRSVDFNPGSGGRAHVQLNLSAVDGRKEIAADQQQHGGPEAEYQDGHDRNDDPPVAAASVSSAT